MDARPLTRAVSPSAEGRGSLPAVIATAVQPDRFAHLAPVERMLLGEAVTRQLLAEAPTNREPDAPLPAGALDTRGRLAAYRMLMELEGVEHDPAALARGMYAASLRRGGGLPRP